jgi:hypothetical protein
VAEWVTRTTVLAWVSESGLARLLKKKQAYQRSASSGPFVLPYDSLDDLWHFILRHNLTFAILRMNVMSG